MEDYIFKYVTLFVSTLTTAVLIYIAGQQMWINKYKLRSDIFDRRIKVYDMTYQTLNNIIMSKNVEQDDFKDFIEQMHISKFIFSDKIADKLNDYYYIIFELRIINSRDKSGVIELSDKTLSILNRENKNNDFITARSFIEIYAQEEFLKLTDMFKDEMHVPKKFS